MKIPILVLTLCLACAYLSTNAQNSASCNASFDFTVTGNTVQFTSATSTVPRLQHWEFGDGGVSNDLNPAHTYANPGTYRVLHRVYDSLQTCFDTLSKLVTIFQTTNCNFTPLFSARLDSLNCKTVNFSNLTAPFSGLMHFTWKFGDSTTSNDLNPIHMYADTGTFNVCLVVEEGPNCRKEYCTTVVVHCVPCHIDPNFDWRIDTVNTSKVYFHNLTVTNSANVQYSWSFGDNTISFDRDPVHVYDQPRQYLVCLTAVANSACQKQVCKTVVIQTQACNVNATFQWKRDTLQRNKIWLYNTSSPVNQVWKTNWYYGDGTSSQDFNSFHTYDHAGKYDVCLKVTSLSGCYSYWCDTVTIVSPVTSCDTLQVSFVYQPNPQKPNVISFAALSNEPLTKQRWVISKDTLVNGSPAQVVLETNNPTYTFTQVGGYRVCLYGTAHDSCVKEYCQEIYIYKVVPDSAHREIPVSVYPNPSNKSVNLMLNLDSRATISVTVLSADGVPQQQMQVSGQTGNNVITIPVDKLSQGMYLVRLRYANQVRLARFQKL